MVIRLVYLLVILMLMATPCFAGGSKVSSLTAETSPSSDDLLYIINDPGGTPGSKKITLSTFLTWVISGGDLLTATIAASTYAPIASPTFTGTVGGITATMVGLGNVTNESKATMFTSPTFTGTVTIPTPFTLGAVSVLPTGTELNFVDGVTSAIQTQLDAKLPKTVGASDFLDMALGSYSNPCVHLADCSVVTGIGRCCVDTDNGNMCIGTGAACAFDATAINAGLISIDRLPALVSGYFWQGNVSDRPEAVNTGSFTSMRLPNSDDPDVSAAGGISYDTDGWIRLYSSGKSAQVGIPENKTIHISIADPENLKTHAGRSTQSAVVWQNNSGMTFTITKVRAMSDTDDYTFDLFISASATDIGTANDTLVESAHFACSTDGTGGYYVEGTTGFEDATIADGQYLIFEDVSGAAENLHIVVTGYYDGNVN